MIPFAAPPAPRPQCQEHPSIPSPTSPFLLLLNAAVLELGLRELGGPGEGPVQLSPLGPWSLQPGEG